MEPEATDWHAVAMTKLVRVMGERPAVAAADKALRELGIVEISSASQLRLFAEQLSEQGGFAGAVGGLLKVHATMYERSR